MKFLIDPALVERVGPERQDDWRLALDQVNEPSGDDGSSGGEEKRPVAYTLSRRPDGGLVFRVDAAGDAAGSVTLSPGMLRRHMGAYRDATEQLSRACVDAARAARSLEGMDHAKKVAHDHGAEAIVNAFAPVADLDYEQARSLFTLVFLISTELSPVTANRHLRWS